MEKDYYKILGITDEEKKLNSEEFKKIVKTKYRSAAKKCHPDLAKNENERKIKEEKFKELAEAYAVLSDDKKRAEYDNPMSGGGNFHFDGADFSDIFSSFGFGGFENLFGGGGRRQNTVVKGQGMRIRLEVSLEDVLNGAEKTIKYKRYDKCHSCNGSGKASNTKVETCPHCKGSGKTYKQNGMWQEIRDCPYCNGEGTTYKNPCPSCNGNGLELVENEIKIQIPKGVTEGFQFAMQGYGHAPKRMEGVYGDLYVVIVEKEHDKFQRNGNDLYVEIKVPIIDAILGCTTEVETIDGKKLSAKIPQGVEDGMQIRFGGYGLPSYEHNNVRGNMIGIIKLVMPKSLTSEERSILENLKGKPNFRK